MNLSRSLWNKLVSSLLLTTVRWGMQPVATATTITTVSTLTSATDAITSMARGASSSTTGTVTNTTTRSATSNATTTATAADTGTAQNGLSCPSAELLSSRLLTDICWECMLPIRIAGAAIGGGKADYPESAVDDAVCSCRDKGDILPRIGYTLGFWQPIRLIELVRTRGCLLSLNGTQTSVGSASHLGTRGTGEIGVDNTAFYHYHYYAFPLLQILGLLNKDICFNQEYLSFDMLYASEIDPTWNYPEIASLVFPETRLFATPQAILGCAADTLAHGAQGTSKGMFWCAGSWGTVYPVSGYDHGIGSGARITSLLATRALTASHRRGFEPQTVGKGALCSTSTETTFNADQYRFTMLYPIAEDGKHPVGASTLTWGEATNTSDAVYMVWRWRDCCSSFGVRLR